MTAVIDPRHLMPETITEYRARYAGHASHILSVPEFLTANTALIIARFLGEQVPWLTTYHISSRGSVDRDAWDAAPAGDRFFKAGLLEAHVAAAAKGRDADAYRKLTAAFHSHRFLSWLEAVTAFRLGRLRLVARAFRKHEYAGAHIDDAGDRRLAWTLYLTPRWRPSFGGMLELKGRGGDFSLMRIGSSKVFYASEKIHYVK